MLLLICIVTFLATLSGGLFAMRFKDHLHLILGFSAGVVIGVAFLDLIPEAMSLAVKQYSFACITGIVVIGFLVYMILDRLALLHASFSKKGPGIRGKLGAGSLSAHSLFDGIAIGLSFQLSQPLGITIALAVIAHDFSDGINTVSLVIKDSGQKRDAFKWLLIDAASPVAGIIIAQFISLPAPMLGMVLAMFAGFFLYIGASDLVPESYHRHPAKWTTIMTIGGVALIYFVSKLAE